MSQAKPENVYHESGHKGRCERPGFDATEAREFDLLLSWRLDRFSRKTISYLQQIDVLGVGFRSYTVV